MEKVIPSRDEVEAALSRFYQLVNPDKVRVARQIIGRFWPDNLEGLLADLQQKYPAQCTRQHPEWERLYAACVQLRPPAPPPPAAVPPPPPPPVAEAVPAAAVSAAAVTSASLTPRHRDAPQASLPTPLPPLPSDHSEALYSRGGGGSGGSGASVGPCARCAEAAASVRQLEGQKAALHEQVESLSRRLRKGDELAREVAITKKAAEGIFKASEEAKVVAKEREARLVEALKKTRHRVAQLTRELHDERSQPAATTPKPADDQAAQTLAALQHQVSEQTRENDALRAEVESMKKEQQQQQQQQQQQPPLQLSSQQVSTPVRPSQAAASPVPSPSIAPYVDKQWTSAQPAQPSQPSQPSAAKEQELAALRHEVEVLSSENEALSRTTGELQQQAAQAPGLSQTLQRMVAENEQLMRENLALTEGAKKVADERRDLDELSREQSVLLRTGLDQLNREKEVLAGRLGELGRENERQEEELQRLRHAPAELAQMQERNKWLEDVKRGLEADVAAGKQELERTLESQKWTQSTQAEEANRFKALEQSMGSTVTMLQNENLTLKQSLTSQDVLKSSIHNLQRQLDASVGSVAQLQQQITAERESKLHEESQKLQYVQKVEDMRERNTVLESRGFTLQQKIDDLRRLLEIQKDENADVVRQLSVAASSVQNMTAPPSASGYATPEADRRHQVVEWGADLPGTHMQQQQQPHIMLPHQPKLLPPQSRHLSPPRQPKPPPSELSVVSAALSVADSQEAASPPQNAAASAAELAALQADVQRLEHANANVRDELFEREAFYAVERAALNALAAVAATAAEHTELVFAAAEAALVDTSAEAAAHAIHEAAAVVAAAEAAAAAAVEAAASPLSPARLAASLSPPYCATPAAATADVGISEHSPHGASRTPPPQPTFDAGASVALAAVLRCVEKAAARHSVGMEPTEYMTYAEQAGVMVRALELLPLRVLSQGESADARNTAAAAECFAGAGTHADQMVAVQREVGRLHALFCGLRLSGAADTPHDASVSDPSDPDATLPRALSPERPQAAAGRVLEMVGDIVQEATLRVADAEGKLAAVESCAAAAACPVRSGIAHALQLRDDAVAAAKKAEEDVFAAVDRERCAAVRVCESAEELAVSNAQCAAASSGFLLALARLQDSDAAAPAPAPASLAPTPAPALAPTPAPVIAPAAQPPVVPRMAGTPSSASYLPVALPLAVPLPSVPLPRLF